MANRRDLAPVLHAMGDRLVEVDVDGHRGWLRSEDVGGFEDSESVAGAVQLLGPFDPLIVGGGLRNHLLPAAHLKRVSRTAGWISPVVLVDGRGAGVWDSRRSGDRLTLTVDVFEPVARSVRRSIAAAAERVAGAHGAEGIVEFGPAYGPPVS